MNIIINNSSFASTQGQWWNDWQNPGVQRRVSCMSSWRGFLLFSLSFQTTPNYNVWPPASKFICQKFFAQSANGERFVFDDSRSMYEWIKKQDVAA